MAKLGSLYTLSEDFINDAVLSTPSPASTAKKNVQILASTQAEPSTDARERRSESEQGMTCLTCGIGIVPALIQRHWMRRAEIPLQLWLLHTFMVMLWYQSLQRSV